VKKRIIVIVAGIFIVLAMVVGLIHINNLNHSNQDGADIDQESITNTTVSPPIDQTDIATDQETERIPDDGIRHINIYTVNRELPQIITQYAKEHWDFPYSLNCYTDEMVYSSNDIINISADKLVNEPSSIDLYCVPAHAREFIKGELSDYACTYKELGIDVDAALEKADIPQYAVDDGSNPEGELIALPFLSTVSVFAYRRYVAKEVWGTDDPSAISEIIGGATGNWEAFKQAAMDLKKHGYYIVPGYKDLFYTLDLSASSGREGMNPQWEEFMDMSKYLYDKGCIKQTEPWTIEWFEDLDGEGDKVFGMITLTDYYQYLNLDNTAGDWAICLPPYITVNDYYTGTLVNKNSPNLDIIGPFIEWLTLDSSESGLQYQIANGTYNENEKLSVISGTVLKNVESSRELLGGQNINPIVYKALKQPDGWFDDYNNSLFYLQEAFSSYLWGGKDKVTVMEEFEAATSPNPQPRPASEKDEVIVWKNKNFERAIRSILRKPKSDIFVNDVTHITELHLEGKKLGSIEDIEYFKNLTHLYCEGNVLKDIRGLEKLTKLEVLHLFDNKIKDISGLKDLVNLKELNLIVNEIEDISTLKGLTKLKKLYLGTNQISDISSITGLTNLVALDLSKNNISNIDSLRTLTKLIQLNLLDNEIDDIDDLNELINVTELYIDSNKISDLSAVEGMSNLSTLSASNNDISKIDYLKDLKKLVYLKLDNNKIKDVSKLSNLQKLSYLEITNNEINDISHLVGLANLKHMDLSGNEISDISSLSECVNLGSLFLADNKITDISVIAKLENLKSLSLAGNDVKDKSPAKHVEFITWNHETDPPY
jgi:Leucine-rich repeat (LRR) protein